MSNNQSIKILDKETLYAFKYLDGSIEYSFGKIRNEGKKEIIQILMEEMTIERKRAFQGCDAETTREIVEILLQEKGFSNEKTYKL